MTEKDTSPLVSTDWLACHLQDDDIRIADASWHMPNQGRNAAADYASAHIPGAVFFDIDLIADTNTSLPHMLPPPDVFAAHMTRLGIGNDCTIVVYDSSEIHSAARVWWMLKYFGLNDVKILDGGLAKWRREGRPLNDSPVAPHASAFTAHQQDHLLASQAHILRASTNGETQILDARDAARFDGREKEPRPGLRTGHIPGSYNLPYDYLFCEDGTMKDERSLKKLFTAAGIDFEKPVITTCGSGITACVLALGLHITGHDNWSVYDGSWSEWGADPASPVATVTRNTQHKK